MNDGVRPTRRDPTIWEALGIAWDLLASVTVTAIIFALLGVFADRWFGTKYVFKIVAFILMGIIGYRIIVKKGRAIANRLNDHPAPKKD
jgi:F0F1-type ATP synthase assembly protein I